MVEVVDHLPTKHEALSSNSITKKQTNNNMKNLKQTNIFHMLAHWLTSPIGWNFFLNFNPIKTLPKYLLL
jgi:hypothetical protein